MDGEVLKFNTETAWAPCNETFDAVREKFPSLRYYFIAEEPGMEVYETNDEYGVYFKDKFLLEASTPEDECIHEYFKGRQEALKWLENMVGKPIRSVADIEDIDRQWNVECEDAYCYLYEFEIVN